MKKLLFPVSLVLTVLGGCQAQVDQGADLLPNLIKAHPDLFGEILEHPERYELQIIYTQINRDSVNFPKFEHFFYGLSPDRYFYPASAVKLPVALLALEKLNRLAIPGLNKDTPLRIESAREPQKAVEKDTTSLTGLPSIGHYIKKIFVVSDNDAYNHLYEFLGQAYINETLWQKGYNDLQILHRLSAPA
ncbi:MAG: serine hydrolase, partial [Bacteroidia bacterium]|nr:serine hydrolase [Bacteroidia bacterium]